MQLIGMLDSPYVRRVAISLHLLELPFEHQPLSVFSTFEQFSQINPIVKAPTLVTNDGTVLMDSTLILQWAESLSSHSLTPADSRQQLRDLRRTGLALAACEKAVQMVYERQLRPSEKQHQPWLDRVGRQLDAAYAALETEFSRGSEEVESNRMTHGQIATAVAWSFTQLVLPGRILASAHPAIEQFTTTAEQWPAFRACPQVDSGQ
ncbi:glutathione S-transferase N-terminal domain-containing protein [Ottowia thiooxydans]|uniref:Glutathione S-transferase n=1 Tax=Ottowia thiooxydans TaxID=219182 RepID=A0ABV2QFW2_9BURK